MDNHPENHAAGVAGEQQNENAHRSSDYGSDPLMEQGLAVTHEQVNDAYMEGTVDGTIDEYAGEDRVSIPRSGYENMFRDANRTS